MPDPFPRVQIPFTTLSEALLAAPQQKAFVTMWIDDNDERTFTFGEFSQWANAQAASFKEHGVRRGDTVILIMPQGVALMAAFTGAMLLGAVPAILAYPTFKVEPAKYRFGLAGISANLKAKLVVVDESFPVVFAETVGLGDQSKVIRVNSLPLISGNGDLTDTSCESQDLAFIQHSAGTTGLQKGVALSHGAVLRQLAHLTKALKIGPHDRIYSWLPLYHDMGLIACFILPMVYHLRVVMQPPTDWVLQPESMLHLISKYKCTLSWVPNFTLQFLARRVKPEYRKEYDLASLRALINCSEPVRAESMDSFTAAFSSCGLQPTALQSSYAMAENVFAVTQSAIDGTSMPRRIWIESSKYQSEQIAVPIDKGSASSACFISSGQCLPNNEVRIVSENGEALPDGHVGEILIRSDSMLDGYYNRPDLTTLSLRDGWYWSGDLGFLLDRELYITGRKKDLIIVGGKNIYPQDVEEIAFSHPAIHDGRAVAFGCYNPDLGTEEIVLVAEVEELSNLGDSSTIDRAIRSAIVADLGVVPRAIYLKPPRWIVKSTAGKPARSATREKLLAEHAELRIR
ncbi:MAG TPA: AMP-binding protein [Candidatus Sulfotelmatobacter sp.]|jgi:fatty-acyl-CoA synthase|nr:AMP-binding protein [Candidatus Sulfotelmatobacter sp.]